MGRRTVLPLIGVLLLAGVAGAEPTPASETGKEAHLPEELSWIVGSWAGEAGGVEMEEHWIAPKGGVMLGLHRDVFDSQPVFFEYLRIESTPEGTFYVASPRGGESTAFRLVEATNRRATFSNPAHDFPQRIVYRLENPDRLCARIEGEREGRRASREWCWRRVGGPSP